MRRRDFIATVGLSGFISRLPHFAPAPEVVCGPVNPAGVQLCEAGILSSILDVTASDTQHASEWCWAACIEGVFSYYGHEVPQERIVAEAWGEIVNRPGSPAKIMQSLNRIWKDEAGSRFSVTADTMTTNAVTAAQDLADDHPLIVGTLGHAMVLTSLQYARDVYGRGQVTLATVRDPWPFNPRRRPLSVQEWYGISFAARIRVRDL